MQISIFAMRIGVGFFETSSIHFPLPPVLGMVGPTPWKTWPEA